MAAKAVKALSELPRCSQYGVSVEFSALLDCVLDYFDDSETDHADNVSDDNSDDACVEGLLVERLNLPENADYETVMKKLAVAVKQEAEAQSQSENNKSDETDQDADAPTVVVDSSVHILKNVEDTLVHEDPEYEFQRIRDFSCNCKEYEEGRCFKQFTAEYIQMLRMSMNALTDGEKDMYIMGKVGCMIHLSENTMCSKRKTQKERSRYRCSFLIETKTVCRNSFRFMHCIGNTRLDKIIKAYANGEISPLEKNVGGHIENERLLTYDDVQRVVLFLNNFAEANALDLPGRIPGFKRDDIKLLPSHETRTSIWRKYKDAMEKTGHRAVGETSFQNLWNRLLPFIIRTRPMTDLCWMCQKNNAAIYRSASLPVVVKNSKLKKQLEHLDIVLKERSLYRTMVTDSKDAVGELKLGTNNPCSRDIRVHYSFDFAQQIHLPSNPLQPGPMYFLVPRKVGIFGINCEAIPQQVNYLIDEGMCSSKGSNDMISYLDHFFETWGLGETRVDLHCDNHSGQNKFLLWYFMWRTIHGLHIQITLNFMTAGHTKFAPDQCFELFKCAFRRTEVKCLEELAKCVSNSSPEAGVNIPQLVGDEACNVMVPVRDWQAYLSPYFKTLDGIKKLHHVRFDSHHPGTVHIKETSDGEEETVQLLKKAGHLPPAARPGSVSPPGLDQKRQWYLFTKIRGFCSEATQDLMCPRPKGPEVHDNLNNIAEADKEEEMEDVELPTKKRKSVQKKGKKNGTSN